MSEIIYKCEFCANECKGALSFSSHINQKHKSEFENYKNYTEQYFLKYVNPNGKKCKSCGIDRKCKFRGLKAGYEDKMCWTCAQKDVWKDDNERKVKQSIVSSAREINSGGRPKGVKNSYYVPKPIGYINNGSFANFSKDKLLVMYEKRAITLRNRSDDEIKEMLGKQMATRINRGTTGKYYQGKFTPKNKEKYVGDASAITYRSGWERAVMRWLDDNPDVAKWNSEEVVIPYICATDKKQHRYFVDIYYQTKDGKKFLVEIKPEKQVQKPVGAKKTKRLLEENLTWIKNMSKWTAAKEFAKDNGVEFVIWTENTLKQLGIKIITKK
jgi:hypothetical protein